MSASADSAAARDFAGQPVTGAASPARLLDLERAKGIAILLVVFGHLVARQEPAGLTWYEPLRVGIYLFHMPFFMYLSGYAAFRFGAASVPLPAWPGLVRKRAMRLLVPFLVFGLVILAGKLAAARLFVVDNVPPDLWHGLQALVWYTSHSPAMSIWYVGVLFVYAVATPLLLSLSGGRVVLPLAVAALLYLLAPPPLLYADRICRFYLFFVAGGLAARGAAGWLAWVDRWRWPTLLALIALAAFVASGQVRIDWDDALSSGPYKWYMLAAGLLAMPAIHGLARLRLPLLDGGLVTLGRRCFVIYLLNTLLIGAAKAVMLIFLPWSAAGFAAMAVPLMVVATIGPLFIKRHIFNRFETVDRLTD